MQTTWLDALWFALLLVLWGVFCGIAVRVWLYLTLLSPLARDVQRGSLAAQAAREKHSKRFTAANNRSFILFATGAVALAVVQMAVSDVPLIPRVSLVTVIACLALAEVARWLGAGVGGILYTATPAYSIIAQATRSHPSITLPLYAKDRLPRYVFILALMWLGTLAFHLRQPWLLVTIPLLTGLASAVTAILDPFLLHWYFRSAPIEQTPWAGLRPRMEAWAALAQLPLRSVEVFAMSSVHGVLAASYGTRNARLLLSDTLLARYDWRQLDAMTAKLIDEARRSRAELAWRIISAIGYGGLLAGMFLLLLLQQTQSGFGTSKSDDFFLVAALTVCITNIALNWISLDYEDQYHHIRWRSDEYGAKLTGDPLAMMVALHTLRSYWGTAPSQFTRRLNRLRRLYTQPGPRAPWAASPVPSPFPFTLNGQLVTVPLASAPPPAPVPTALYPTSQPVAATSPVDH